MHPDLPAELAALTALLLGPDTAPPPTAAPAPVPTPTPAPVLVVAPPAPEPAAATPDEVAEAPFEQTASGLVDARRSSTILAELSFLDD